MFCNPIIFANASGRIPPWLVMFGIVGAIFLLLKGVTLLSYERSRKNQKVPLTERLIWFAAWPGMNPWQFFRVDATVTPPTRRAWTFAASETMIGGILFGVVAPRVVASHELVGGWVAMIGLIFLLHFGSLHLVALFWRRLGRPVEPIMRAPVLARSLDEFWSRRWNLAFRDFASAFIFRPLTRRFGSKVALFGGFAFSGLVHDLAISVPARGGYGLPTAYFLLQAAGVVAERSRLGRQIGLGRGWAGWLFALVVTTPVAFFLFHPPFVREVILPLIPLGAVL
jgi:hypothetical protein